MFLRQTRRKKDGKTHSYRSVVENQRLDGDRVVQRPVLYLGEINSSQAALWRKAIEVLDEDAGRSQTLALFPEDRCDAVTPDASIVQLRLSKCGCAAHASGARAGWPGSCGTELQLDRFWSDECRRAPRARDGIRCCRCWRRTG
jgi:hypothetical protein